MEKEEKKSFDVPEIEYNNYNNKLFNSFYIEENKVIYSLKNNITVSIQKEDLKTMFEINYNNRKICIKDLFNLINSSGLLEKLNNLTFVEYLFNECREGKLLKVFEAL